MCCTGWLAGAAGEVAKKEYENQQGFYTPTMIGAMSVQLRVNTGDPKSASCNKYSLNKNTTITNAVTSSLD